MLLNKIYLHPQFFWKSRHEKTQMKSDLGFAPPYHQKSQTLTKHVLTTSLWALLVRCTNVLLGNRTISGEKQIFLSFSAQFRRKKNCSFLKHAAWQYRSVTKVNLKLIKKTEKTPRENTDIYTKKWSFQQFFSQKFLQNTFTSSKTNSKVQQVSVTAFSESSTKMHIQTLIYPANLFSKSNWKKEKWLWQPYAPNKWSKWSGFSKPSPPR